MKQLDLKMTVAELIQAYPELREILNEIGFSKILNPMALKAMGNIMTLPRGAAVRNIPMEKIISTLEANGFSIVGQDENEGRKAKLRGYIERLGKGGCSGCRTGKCLLGDCRVKDCNRERGVDYCFQCPDFAGCDPGLPAGLAERWRDNNRRMAEMGLAAYCAWQAGRPRY